MSARRIAVFAVSIAAVAAAAALLLRAPNTTAPAAPDAQAVLGPTLAAISPRVISNQTSYPVMLFGERLEGELVLVLEDEAKTRVPALPVDARHRTALIPAGLKVMPGLSSVEVKARLESPAGAVTSGDARLTIVNDAGYVTPYAMELLDGGKSIAIASPSTDQLFVDRVAVAAGDGPRALAVYRDAKGEETLAVAGARGELRTAPTGALGGEVSWRVIRVASDLQDLAIDPATRTAYCTSHTVDRVFAVDLDSGTVKSSFPVGVNPRAIALAEKHSLAIVANQLSQDLTILELATGTERRVRPAPGASIIGGHTVPYAQQIMGDTPARAIVADDEHHVVFVATLGPNIGPNRDRMEVTMESGVSVIDARAGKFLRHVSILGGVAESLALDVKRRLLYVADSSTGRVVVLDAARLAKTDATAKTALLGALLLPRPATIPPIRPPADFGVQNRATESLHFGPRSLRLDPATGTLWVLSKFSGEVVQLDTSKAAKGTLAIKQTLPALTIGEAQTRRRQGEVIYFTDFGNSRMTCDTCHPEGHTGGIMFSKGALIRIYRAPTVRAIRESPPYFTPSRLRSIRRTAKDVLARNRFNNPIPTREELDALTEFTGTFAVLPNPYYLPTGELPNTIELPDGATGDPLKGLALFEGKLGCANERCHPPPSFTADQKKATRGLLQKVGTPIALQLRPEQQDLQQDFGQPAPSLLGVWDIFPLFLSGGGGNEVAEDGTISATHPFALRWIFENPAWAGHAGGPSWTTGERNDLLAYVLTL